MVGIDEAINPYSEFTFPHVVFDSLWKQVGATRPGWFLPSWLSSVQSFLVSNETQRGETNTILNLPDGVSFYVLQWFPTRLERCFSIEFP